MNPKSSLTNLWWVMLLILGVVTPIMSNVAVAGTGGYTSFTYGDPRKGSALKIEIVDWWVVGDGYRPLRVRISPIGRAKFLRDRQVTLQFDNFHNRPMTPRELTTRVIDLPEGAPNVTTTVYALQNRIQRTFQVEMWEGQRTARNVAARTLVRGIANDNWNESTPAILFLDYGAPPFEQRGSAGLAGFRAKQYESLEVLNPTEMAKQTRGIWPAGLDKNTFGDTWIDVCEKLPSVEIIHPTDLPDQWIGLTCVDVMYIKLPDLERLKNASPDAFAVVNSWMRAGGVLMVSDVGEEFERMDSVDSLFPVAALSANGAGDEEGDESNRLVGWTKPSSRLYGRNVSQWRVQNNGGYQWVNGSYIQVVDEEEKLNSKQLKKLRGELGLPFVFRDVQLGTIVLFESQDPVTDPNPRFWSWVFRTIGSERWMSSHRNGFSPTRENDNFWNFLIPGVGLAPVYSFQVIITVFVLIIGPLNYSMLKRRNRLNWMLFTVPAAALLITLGLIGYALLTDGASVKSRVRSVTSLDQTAEHAATWARQSYYAGIAPSRGITFEQDAVVMPVDFDPIPRLMGFAQRRSSEWEGGNLRLRRGFLTSRTTSQFVVKRSRSTSMALEWEREGDNLVGATNKLQGDIAWLLVHDQDGTLYQASDVKDGAQIEFEEVDPGELATLVQERVLDKNPTVPEGVDVSLISSQRNNGRAWQYRNQNSHLGPPTFATSRMETLFSGINIYSRTTTTATTTAAAEATKPTTAKYSGLDRGTYLAVMKKHREIPLGFSKVTELDSFYLIIGRW